MGSVCNVIKVEDTLREVKVPDISAVDLLNMNTPTSSSGNDNSPTLLVYSPN